MITREPTLDRVLRAVADPTRRRILQALKLLEAKASAKSAGLCAGDIERRVRLSQSTVSHHMSILAKVGLIQTTKQGQWRWYRRNETAIGKLVKSLQAKL
jgi:DNA-binding transcriptional ArsR family regulator